MVRLIWIDVIFVQGVIRSTLHAVGMVNAMRKIVSEAGMERLECSIDPLGKLLLIGCT